MTALLVYLASKAGHKYRREALAELLWPALPVESARFNLRHTLFHLRLALGGDRGAQPFLLSGRDWLSFNQDSACRIDAVAFAASVPTCVATPFPQHCDPCIEKMEYMAGLYRGEFLAEFSLPDCQEFEDWLQIQRESLRRHAIALLERLSDCHEQAGAYSRALPFALRYAELEPWSEEAHCRAMRLFALAGQGGAALAQYDACCRALKKELGGLPGERTRNLAERIRKGELHPEDDAAKGKPPLPFLPPLAEQRQVTVLYCELTPAEFESTRKALALLHAPQKRCIKIIRGFSGHIVQSHGGGLMAYFGYPQNSENAARQAAQAIQAALECVGEAEHGLEVRAGIHTGLIAAGADAEMPEIIGLTSGIAIRLRLEAKSGEVVISAVTHRLAGKNFNYKSLGEHQLSDVFPPLEVFKVKGERVKRKRASDYCLGKQFEALFSGSDRIACRIAEDIAPMAVADPRYRNAKKNTSESARNELIAAFTRIAGSLLKDDAEFYRQLVQNKPFRQFVTDMVISLEKAGKARANN
ncbi:MAG: hypothetical protein A3F73_06930 [Gallionellales bacterium RIFCSPLOWO2_12_FULL_59_22]|nr:MAG: hypothetical protein A3H99_03830 [Gallionellales bacterium RIFCSPLOWO2_02_FULL_59_110]OGT02289.1 MAG: hypothetical protein A2Z65_02305 [Gallionellales bacterium RIFCSPLOWO2_02_58_13]OGT14130.1 MAG: hypothetical protein A3F73_06930 [Gallionellales bacterium RIFCSPLOWO2_12_FULL_59_22]